MLFLLDSATALPMRNPADVDKNATIVDNTTDTQKLLTKPELISKK